MKRRNFGTFIQAKDPDVLLPSAVLESFNSYERKADTQLMRYGGIVTYEKPIREFFGDVNIGSGVMVTLRAGTELPNNCVGLRFLNVVPNVMVNINGGGWRTVLNGDGFNGCEIVQVSIQTDAAGSCTVQAVGTGD